MTNMESTVKEIILKKFERLVKFFNILLIIHNMGYRTIKPRFYNYFIVLIIFVSTCFNIKHIFLTYNSFNRIQATYTITFIAVHIQSLGKALSIVIDYNDFKKLFEEIGKIYTDIDHPLIMERRMVNNRTLLRNVIYGLLIYSVGLWFGEIFLQVFISSQGGIPFPMQYYIPFIEEDNPYFFIVNSIFQDAVYFIALTSINAVDVIIFTMTFQFRSELICLTEVIAQLNESEVYSVNKGFLRDIFRMHLNTIRLFNILSKIYFYMSLAQVTSSFHGLCFLLYGVLVHGLDISSLIILIVVTGQLFGFCLIGELLYAKTASLPNVFYLTKWYEFSSRDKKDLALMLQMSQQAYVLKAAGVIDVSIFTFVEVIKLAGSYCAIFFALSK
ncbi:hypothetical protein DMENIID0001_022790 [Sergentomyia squamirostris]